MSSSFKSALNGDDEMNIIYAYKNSSHNWTVMITFFPYKDCQERYFNQPAVQWNHDARFGLSFIAGGSGNSES